MTHAITLFLALTLTLAALAVLYVAGVVRVFRSPPVAQRALVLVPLLTPFIAWRTGARALPIAMAVLGVTYVVLFVWPH